LQVKKITPSGQAETVGVNVGDVIIEIEGTGVRGLPWSYINSEIVTDAKANIEGKQTRISIVFLRKREQRDEPTEPKQEVPAEDSADAVPPPAPYPFTAEEPSQTATGMDAKSTSKRGGRKMSWLQRADAEEHKKEAEERERVRLGGARRTSVLKQAGTQDGSVVEVIEDIPPPAAYASPSNKDDSDRDEPTSILQAAPNLANMPSINEEMDDDTDDDTDDECEDALKPKTGVRSVDTKAVRKARKGSWIDALLNSDESALRNLKTAVDKDQQKTKPDEPTVDESHLRDVFNSLDTQEKGALKRVDLIKALRKNTKMLCELLKLPPRLSQSDGSMAVRYYRTSNKHSSH
jgi:hypothetical protein